MIMLKIMLIPKSITGTDAGTGPRPNGTEVVALQQRAAADGRDAASHQEEAAAPPTYAEVDKSKKKKEEKLDYTYAEVDKSKKSKKVYYSKGRDHSKRILSLSD